MTAPISRGSSGGPVLNRKGRVIGVSQSMYHPLDGILLNFAVPSNALETLLGQSGKAKPLSHGNTAVSYIGCMIRGYEKRMSGDYAGAIREFTDAIDLDPNAATTYILRGICRAELGQHFAAIADYDIAIRLDPADPDAYFMRGVAKGALDQHLSAIADCDIAIRLKPDYAEAYLQRGISKAVLFRFSAAKRDLRTALRFAKRAGNRVLRDRIQKALRLLQSLE